MAGGVELSECGVGGGGRILHVFTVAEVVVRRLQR